LAFLRAALHDFEHVVTSSQHFSHFLRHVNGRLHVTHTLVGRFSFFTPRGMTVSPLALLHGSPATTATEQSLSGHVCSADVSCTRSEVARHCFATRSTEVVKAKGVRRMRDSLIRCSPRARLYYPRRNFGWLYRDLRVWDSCAERPSQQRGWPASERVRGCACCRWCLVGHSCMTETEVRVQLFARAKELANDASIVTCK
jgi:hypothetical protein